MANYSIKSKSRALLSVTIAGLLLVLLFTYISFNKVEYNYSKSETVLDNAGNLKSIMVGGLLINSASNVLIQNPKSSKPKEAIKLGIKKFETYLKKNKRG